MQSPKLTRRDLTRIAAAGIAAQAVPLAVAQSDAKAPAATAYVTDFILNTKYEDLPAQVLELSKKSILDGLGLALCGSVAKSGGIVRQYLKSQGISSGPATVIGSNIKAPVRFAAFANGIGIHADDYDDTQLAVAPDRVYGLLTHPSAPALPAVLGFAETKSKTGRELLTAYNVGVEVECKVAEAIFPRHYEDGFHSTGTSGVFGSVAAAVKLLGYDRAHVITALSIGASEAAGLRENFGTMTKPLHAGRASESGVVAAELAALGWTAADQILEAPRGFFHAAGGGFDPNAIMGKLGKPWTFVSPGISIKPYPSGSLTHPGMTEMERLIKANKITAAQIERVRVGTNKNTPNALIHHKPTDNLQAKFSMEFCMATLLLYGKGGLTQFVDEVVNRPEVQEMIKRIDFGVDPVAEAAGYNKMTTILEIKLKDGRMITGRADFGRGSPEQPMSYDDVAAKFEDCAQFAKWPAAKAKQVITTVRKLEELTDIRRLTALLSV